MHSQAEASYVELLPDGNVEADINAALTHPRSRRNGVIYRRFDTGQRTAQHINLHIPAPVQNEQRGRVLVARAAQLYRCLGIDEMRLNAVGIGRHAWAACGFSFSHEQQAALVRADARNTLRDLGEDPGIIRDDDDAWELAGIEGLVPLADLAEIHPLEADVLGDVGEISFGKAIIPGPASEGMKRTRDAIRREVIKVGMTRDQALAALRADRALGV